MLDLILPDAGRDEWIGILVVECTKDVAVGSKTT